MIKDYFTISFKNLKHRGIRSWLTLLGIFIGVVAVVALISLGSGLKLAVSSQFDVASKEIITVEAGGISGYGPPGSNVANPLTINDVEKIEKLGSVKRSVRRNMLSGKLEYNDHLIFGYFMSIPSGDNRDFVYEQLNIETVNGRLLKDSDVKKVFLGYNFYVDKVGLDKEVISGKRVLIQDAQFEVIGILEKKGSFIFDNMVYMNDRDLEDLFGFGEDVDVIVVQPTNKDNLDKAKEDIEKLLRKTRDVKTGEEDFEVSTADAALATVNSILSGVQIFIALIAGISIFIGALGIVNTMTTSVLERKKEIGIMKAIGARNSQIFFQFFVESGLLGLIGGIIGTVIGVLIGVIGIFTLNNFLGTELKPVVDYFLIFYVLLGSFLVGAIAGIVPAMNAAKQNPVEALRF
jgi:putative ABC transport system permease protein